MSTRRGRAGDDGGTLHAGDRVQLIDTRKRRYSFTLALGGAYHFHAGIVRHDDLIGTEEGVVVETSLGQRVAVLRPTLADHVFSMPRVAQVIYPKDLGAILMLADLFPGARVFESGVGSGALTTAALRAIGREGSLLAYELRDDMAASAARNVETFLGEGWPLELECRDAYEGIDAEGLDRVLLDLPEPWRMVPHAEHALRGGGIFLAYLPTIGQVAELHRALGGSALQFGETVEVFQRSWHVTEESVRPDHRMVAHTGFLTTARVVRGDLGTIRPRRRNRSGVS